MINTWCSSHLSAQLLWWQPAFEVSLVERAFFMKDLLEKKSRSLCFFSFFRSHLVRKAHLASSSLINEAFSLRLNPSITLTSINIHKYSFILLITTNQTYFIINLSLPPDYAQCFAASAFIIYLNWAEAAHCGQSKRFLQSWFAPPSGFIWKVQL